MVNTCWLLICWSKLTCLNHPMITQVWSIPSWLAGNSHFSWSIPSWDMLDVVLWCIAELRNGRSNATQAGADWIASDEVTLWYFMCVSGVSSTYWNGDSDVSQRNNSDESNMNADGALPCFALKSHISVLAKTTIQFKTIVWRHSQKQSYTRWWVPIATSQLLRVTTYHSLAFLVRIWGMKSSFLAEIFTSFFQVNIRGLGPPGCLTGLNVLVLHSCWHRNHQKASWWQNQGAPVDTPGDCFILKSCVKKTRKYMEISYGKFDAEKWW